MNPKPSDVYETRRGNRCVVVSVDDQTVTLRHLGRHRLEPWTLPLRFFLSKACGWKPVRETK